MDTSPQSGTGVHPHIHPDAISPGESFLQLRNLSEPTLVLSLKVSSVFQQSLSLHLERIFEKKKKIKTTKKQVLT